MWCSIGRRTSRPFGSVLDSFDCNATSSSKRVATRASGVPSVERRLRHFVFGAGAYSFGGLLSRKHAATCNHRVLELAKQRISCLSNVESFGCNG